MESPKSMAFQGTTPLLVSRDLSKTLAFYRDSLGFTPEMVWPTQEKPQFCSLVRDDTHLLFESASDFRSHPDAPNADMLEKHPWGIGVYLYVYLDNVDDFWREVNDKCEVVKPISTRFYGNREFMIRDPDGYLLTFSERIPLVHCTSCNLPMRGPEDHAGGALTTPYCYQCVDENGELKPFERLVEEHAAFLHLTRHLERGRAREEAERILSKASHWRKLKAPAKRR